MTDFTAIESIFFAALDKPAGQERIAFLNSACGPDTDLRMHVERLLVAQPQVGSFLMEPAPAQMATTDQRPITERPGTVIGAYKLMEQIGEGGFGLVFVADQQQPVRRKVALKIIKPGMDSRDIIARFEAERQALALMDHPNIAKVFDAGATQSGRPYFVMELVKGIPIVEYCDQQQLTTSERLDLFLSVCQAVQHAHSKGIIHRDLKPSNILVAPHDGVPVVKVIDFGVAKAIGQQLTDKTIYTRFTQMIGTPLYMSPEQTEINALDVDIRSDVYSLGVLLYELLTGTTPFDQQRFATAAYDEIRRIIREEEPPKPSTRLSTLGEALSAVSAKRKTEPAKLSAFVKGDLDWIVMKALEKDRARRYETASALAAEVRRFLSQEPIEARPPSAWYRFRKLAQRNRVALTTAALVATALVLGTVVSAWQAVRATVAEQEARLSAEAAGDQKRAADDAKGNAEKRSNELAAVNEKLRRLNYITDMNLAQSALEQYDYAFAGQLLERHRPKPGEADLRGFEWNYLRMRQDPALFTLHAHDGYAVAVAWTPDGKRLVSFGLTSPEQGREGPEWASTRRGDVKLWDVATRRQLPLRLDGLTDTLFNGCLSPDGKRLAGACRDKTVRVWNLETGELIAALEGHTFELVTDVVFSSDGKHLASKARSLDVSDLATDIDSAEIRIWDLEARKAIVSINKLPAGGPPVFSPDGKRLAARAGTQLLKVWDATSGREILVKDLKFDVFYVSFSPVDNRVVVTGKNKEGHILDADTGEQVTTFFAEGLYTNHPTFSPDGNRLAATDGLSSLIVWNAESGEQVRTFRGHAAVTSLAFSPGGTLLASSGWDGCIRVWDTIHDTETIPIASAPPKDYWVELSPDGRIAMTGFSEGAIHLWNAATGELRGEPLQLENNGMSWDFTADGKRLVLTDGNRNVTIWDSDTSKKLHEFKHDSPLRDFRAQLSPDGKWFACKGLGGELKVWDVEKGIEFRSFAGLAESPSFLFCPNGAHLAAVDKSGVVKLWDVATGRELWSVKTGVNGFALSFSPDGKRMAVRGFASAFAGSADVHILDAESGHEISPPLQGITGHLLIFSPDGNRLITKTYDSTLKVWDIASGQETLSLKGHEGLVTGLAFSRDGHRLISVSADMTVRIWDATPLSE